MNNLFDLKIYLFQTIDTYLLATVKFLFVLSLITILRKAVVIKLFTVNFDIDILGNSERFVNDSHGICIES